MSVPQKLINLVCHFEGCQLQCYLDEGGVPTIGWGSTGPDITQQEYEDGLTWTQEQCDDRRDKEIQEKIDGVLKMSPILGQPGNEDRLIAIADFAYNLGLGAYQTSHLRRCVDAGDWAGAAGQIVLWNHCAGKVLAGLTKRREAEAALLT